MMATTMTTTATMTPRTTPASIASLTPCERHDNQRRAANFHHHHLGLRCDAALLIGDGEPRLSGEPCMTGMVLVSDGIDRQRASSDEVVRRTRQREPWGGAA